MSMDEEKNETPQWKMVHPVSFRLPEKMRLRIFRCMRKSGMSRTAIIKHCLATSLPKLEKE